MRTQLDLDFSRLKKHPVGRAIVKGLVNQSDPGKWAGSPDMELTADSPSAR